MKTISDSSDLIKRLDELAQRILGMDPVWAYYPCSGTDANPFAFLLPEFIQQPRFGVAPECSPNAFLYVDDHDLEPETYQLDRNIGAGLTVQIDAPPPELPPDMRLYRVTISPTGGPETFWDVCERAAERKAGGKVYYLPKAEAEHTRALFVWKTDHCEATARLRAGKWKPTWVVAVNDGSAMGGNKHGLNNFAQKEEWNPTLALRPRYLVTDHLYIEGAGCVENLDRNTEIDRPQVGVTLIHLGRLIDEGWLAQNWGTYGKWGIGGGSWGLGGATLFEVKRHGNAG